MDSQERISLVEKTNISHDIPYENNLSKSAKKIIIEGSSKKSVSPPGRIRAYKNKYNSPEINRLKPTQKNRKILDVKHFKNKNNNINNEIFSLTEQNYLENSINLLNSQNFARKIILKEKILGDNNEINMNNTMGRNTQIPFSLSNDNNKEIINNPNNNIINNQKILKKSQSLNQFFFTNKEIFDEFENIHQTKKQTDYDFIKLNFPKEQIIKNNSIEFIQGKLKMMEPRNSNNNLILNNADKQIINQENIIINNGFVNMNNNYYVNNNNINNELKKDQNNGELINNDMNEIKYNHDMNYENEIMYNTDNFFNSKMYDLDIINNKPSNNLLNMNYNNDYNNPNNIYDNNKKYFNILNRENETEYKFNQNQPFNPIYKQENLYNDNYNNETKESNYNFEENNFETNYKNLSPRLPLRYNYPNNSGFYNINNKEIGLVNNYIRDKNRFNNNYNSRNEKAFRQIPNPQYFHPNFHPNISFQYISVLKIQYPVQIMVKKSKKISLAKHKLINYFPPKVQIEIRPCLVFQPFYKKKKKSKRVKKSKDNKLPQNKVKHRRPVFRIPPFKKASLSQGKTLNFIHKYYDENFILEEDNDDDEEKNVIKTMYNIENHKEEKEQKEQKMDDKKDINIIDNEKDTKNEINNKEMNSNEISIEIKKIDKIPEKEFIDKIKVEKKNVDQLAGNKENKNKENKNNIKEKHINRMKIPIRNDNAHKINKNDKIVLINIKKPKRSPIKDIINKKDIKNIFSLDEINKKFSSMNILARINSPRVSIDKSRENTITNKSKNKIIDKKDNNKNKNIKIISYLQKKKLIQKSNSFRSKKAFDKINLSINKTNNSLNNSYKKINLKKIIEKHNSKKSFRNKVVKIDLSKI